MRILIFGAGAIGSVLGGFLAKAGHDVTLLGRSWHLDVIEREGLVLSGLWGEHRIRARAVSAVLSRKKEERLTLARSVAELAREPEFDWVFVCVKAHHTSQAAMSLPAVMGTRAFVCAFQNGLGNYETLIRYVPSARMALGRIIFGAEIEPGRVRVSVCADDVLIGAPDKEFPLKPLAKMREALQESGIPCQTTDSIIEAIWAKVLYNAALNGLSTLLEVPYGVLLEREVTRQLMEAVVHEAYRVIEERGILLRPETARAYRDLLFDQLIPLTATHRSSMLQDLRRGKASEIEALNGALVRLGQQAGIPTPVNALITRLVHAKERFMGIEEFSL